MKSAITGGLMLAATLGALAWASEARAGACVSREGSAPTKGMDYNCFSNEQGSFAINVNGGPMIYFFNPTVTALGDSRATGRNGSFAFAQVRSVSTALNYSLASTFGDGAEASAEDYSHAQANNHGALAVAENDGSAWVLSVNGVAIATDGACAYVSVAGVTSVAEAGQCVNNGVVVWDEESGAGSQSACRCLIRPLD